MNKIVSDESLRRGLKHLAPALERGPEEERLAREAQLAKTATWMDRALAESTREALVVGWILDIDTTIKLLYGHQDGADISYNPVSYTHLDAGTGGWIDRRYFGIARYPAGRCGPPAGPGCGTQ